MLEKLTVFYEEHGISPFRCCSLPKCNKANSPRFTEAKASYVGPHYEKRQLPRLLFLSLDSGEGCSDPEQRTIEAVRCQNLATDVETLEKNKHWYRNPRNGTQVALPIQVWPQDSRYTALLCPRQQCEVLPEQKKINGRLTGRCLMNAAASFLKNYAS